MRMRTVCRPLAFLLVLCLLVGTVRSALALTLDQETELGKKFLVDIRKQYTFVDDAQSRAFVNDLGAYLTRFLGTRPFPLHFYIIQASEMNAFAGPGGHVFFFTGLIESMESVDELAAVMAHEMGHISARHLSKRIEQYKKMSMATMAGMLLGALIGGKAAQAIMVGTMAAGAQTQLAFSRTDERQADQLGFATMRESGFDPAAMITVLNRMQGVQIYGTDQIPAYLRTHPTGPERMANMDSLLSAEGAVRETAEADTFRDDFPVVRTLLTALYADSSTAVRRFQKELEKDPDSALAHFGLGLCLKDDDRYEEALTHFKQALDTQPGLVQARTHMGETQQLMGQYAEAIPVLERALAQDAGNRKALFLLAVSYQNLDSYSKAIRLYERLLSLEPVQAEVYYNLGYCHGRLDELARAHYYFGIFFMQSHEPQKARFHFEKAEDLARHDMDMLRKIQKEAEALP